MSYHSIGIDTSTVHVYGAVKCNQGQIGSLRLQCIYMLASDATDTSDTLHITYHSISLVDSSTGTGGYMYPWKVRPSTAGSVLFAISLLAVTLGD
jgi:hypothetical protein